MENSRKKIIHPIFLTAKGSPQKMSEPELAARVLTVLCKMFLPSSLSEHLLTVSGGEAAGQSGVLVGVSKALRKGGVLLR